MASFVLNYMTIAQVRVFNGFAVGPDGRPLMKKQLWNILGTPGLPPGKVLLCKLVPYNATFVKASQHTDDIASFEYRPMKSLQLPIYNEHFMIQF